MKIKTAKSRFIFQAPLTLVLARKVAYLSETCRRLYSARDFAELDRIASYLPDPLKAFYSLLARQDFSSPIAFDFAGLSDPYRCRTLLAIGQSFNMQGDTKLGEEFTLDALKWASRFQDGYVLECGMKELAIIESQRGNHHKALNHLQEGFKIARQLASAYPAEYLNYLNSLALEFSATGNVCVAAQCIKQIVNSQYIERFPEWMDTEKQVLSLTDKAHSVIIPVVPRRTNLRLITGSPMVVQDEPRQSSEGRMLDKEIFSRLIDSDNPIPVGVKLRIYNLLLRPESHPQPNVSRS
jgi:tetratricopeptide (TPR) repeat protein